MGFEPVIAGAPALAVARSFSGRRWRVRTPAVEAARLLSEVAPLSPTLAQILAGRGIGPEAIADLLQPTLKRLLPDPCVLKDMDQAVRRVAAALEGGEEIAIFGDYDVDGSCSAALLDRFLSALGRAPRVYIPDRLQEGYGPNTPALLALKEQGASLVVTVDCGAAAQAPFAAARAAGLDIVVLDHHAAGQPLPVVAHVNPNRVDDTAQLGHLCAAGVTFLFVVALNRHLRGAGWYAARGLAAPDLMELLDLVALATVCDVVPLIGVNRAFVRQGLLRLSANARPGLAALCEAARAAPPFSSYTLGFLLGPRINAGGRVGRCDLGHQLLMAPDLEAARPLAALLDRHNRERQSIEATILEEAIALAALQHNQPFILLAEQGWHPGVVGIVAGRLKDRFAKPAFIAGFFGGEGRGSARSMPGFDIGEAIRAAAMRGLIAGGGGHAMAAGFSLAAEQVAGLREFLHAHFAAQEPVSGSAQGLELDAIMAASACSESLVDELQRMGPFGAGNPEPLIGIGDVVLAYADEVGQGHLKMRLVAPDSTRIDAIAFRTVGTALGDGLMGARGKPIHVAGRLKCDEWNGRRRVQFHLEDAAAAQA